MSARHQGRAPLSLIEIWNAYTPFWIIEIFRNKRGVRGVPKLERNSFACTAGWQPAEAPNTSVGLPDCCTLI